MNKPSLNHRPQIRVLLDAALGLGPVPVSRSAHLSLTFFVQLFPFQLLNCSETAGLSLPRAESLYSAHLKPSLTLCRYGNITECYSYRANECFLHPRQMTKISHGKKKNPVKGSLLKGDEAEEEKPTSCSHPRDNFLRDEGFLATQAAIPMESNY